MGINEAKYFIVFCCTAIISVCLYFGFTNYNAVKAGLEQCPKNGAGNMGDSIWVKSCTEYSKTINESKGITK